ncbi:MAG: alpha/beta fold hydrolase [Ferruginibacter sp.]
MSINKKRIFFWVKIFVIIYCGGGISLYYLQETFLFHPKKLSADHVFDFKIPFKEVQIPVNKTDTISLVKFFPTGSVSKGVLVYYHGNMENVEYYEHFVSAFTRYGYEVWMPDYPGYGKSTGDRTEKKMYDEAWLVQRMAMNMFHSDSITIYGKSLGTGIAAYAASASRCKQLILETPYYSITNLFNHYAFMYPVSMMIKYKIPTWQFLEDVKVPVTIFHGTNDKIIPYSCAEKLQGSMKPGDQFITIPGGSHNDLTNFESYQHVMDSLLLQ